MIEKHGDLRDDSVGDDFTGRKATHVEKDGFTVLNKEAVEALKKEKPITKIAFEEI